MERELKLSFSSVEDMDRLWSDTVFASYKLPDSCKETDFKSIYYDTVDYLLRGKMASLRIRRIIGGGYIHTVKIKIGEKDGLHQRYEWNLETDQDSFDIDFFLKHAISDDDPYELLKELLEKIRGRELKSLFTTVFHRKAFMVEYNDSFVEVANDCGKVSVDSSSVILCEMELELVKGSVHDIVALGDKILAHTNAKLYHSSKYQRGMQLLKEIQAKNE